MKKVILIVDDDKNYVKTTKELLEDNDYEVICAFDGKEAIKCINERYFDVLLLDKNLPDITGMDILKNFSPSSPKTVVFMVTAVPSVVSAVDAIKCGADNYISKPFDDMELLFKIEKELQLKQLQNDNEELKCIIDEKYRLEHIIGKSAVLQEIQATIQQLKNSDVTILITGDTGTGKGLLAKGIHYASSRRDYPFVIINAGTLSENILESELFGHVKGAFTGAHKDKIGLFQSADKGTVFIDEIGDMPYSMQIKLLRVLEDKEFEPVGSTKTVKTDVRIIAATNKDLESLISENKFRKDLFFRLNVVHFELPFLKDRKEDIPSLVNYFINSYCNKYNIGGKKISEEVLDALLSYSWPGNIRELENCVERMVLLEKSDTFKLESMPRNIRDNQGAISVKEAESTTLENDVEDKTLEELERDYLIQLLSKYNGQINRLSAVLKIDRKTIYRKLLKYGLDKKLFK